MKKDNENCKIKIEIDQIQKMNYEEVQKLFLENNGYKTYPKEFTDLCEGVDYKIIKIAIIPFSGTTRQQFMNAVCSNNKTFEEGVEIYKNYENTIWSVECIVSDCYGGVFKSFRMQYVDYCLRNSSK